MASKECPGVAEFARAGHLGLATSDAFLIDRLTNEYVSDVTTASRTSLMDLRSCSWDAELCRIFEVPFELLPAIRPSAGHFGMVTRAEKQVPIVANIVDQQAALFGHGCRNRVMRRLPSALARLPWSIREVPRCWIEKE